MQSVQEEESDYGSEVRKGKGEKDKESNKGKGKKKEVESDESDSVEIVGFSPAALQFYKATGKSLPTPEYSGEVSEITLLAWQRGAERYFLTYGIEREQEKVMIGADLLRGEAATWWNSLWMTGRQTMIQSWKALGSEAQRKIHACGNRKQACMAVAKASTKWLSRKVC